jgi:methionyl-tRNA synthetase
LGDKTVMGVSYRQRYSDDAAKLEAVAVKRMEEAMNAVFGEIGRVTKTINPAPPSDKHLASEIRSTLKQMSAKDREIELARASDTVIEALAAAPAFVSKLSDEAVEHRIKSWQVSKYPDEVARLQRLSKALAAAREVGVSFKGYIAELANTIAQPIITQSVKRTEAAKEAVAAAIAE